MHKTNAIPDVQTLLGTTAPSLVDHHLFDQFLVVGLPPDYQVHSRYHNEQQQHEPQVIYKFPPDKPVINRMIPHFCFPNGLTTTANQRVISGSALNALLYSPMAQLEEPTHSFVFLLTGEATVYYGVCVLKTETLDMTSSFFNAQTAYPETSRSRDGEHKGTQPKATPLRALGQLFDISTPRVYCFISRFPFIKMHFYVLISVLERERMLLFAGHWRDPSVKADATSSIAILQYYYNLKFVDVHQPIVSLTFPNEKAAVRFHCPRNDEPRLLAEWSLFTLFERLDVENIIEIFSYMLQERSILIISPIQGLLSSVCLGMLSLLKPFVWQCAVVPILPQKMWESIESPVPFFMGLCTLPPRVGEEHDYLLIDLSRNLLVRPRRRAPLVPEYSRLCNAIQHHKDAFRGANQPPMQHKKFKFIEDVIISFKEYQAWLLEVVANSVISCLPTRSKTSNLFLDNENNTQAIIKTLKPEHQEFFVNLFRTQMFSAHALILYASIDAKLHYSKETLKKLKELIAMEEKSREVLLEYARCGIHSQEVMSKALQETETTLMLLNKSRKELEGEMEKTDSKQESSLSLVPKKLDLNKSGNKKPPLLGLERFTGLGLGSTLPFGRSRPKSQSQLSKEVEKQILSQPLGGRSNTEAGTRHTT